jgi:hypothetical protein
MQHRTASERTSARTHAPLKQCAWHYGIRSPFQTPDGQGANVHSPYSQRSTSLGGMEYVRSSHSRSFRLSPRFPPANAILGKPAAGKPAGSHQHSRRPICMTPTTVSWAAPTGGELHHWAAWPSWAALTWEGVLVAVQLRGRSYWGWVHGWGMCVNTSATWNTGKIVLIAHVRMCVFRGFALMQGRLYGIFARKTPAPRPAMQPHLDGTSKAVASDGNSKRRAAHWRASAYVAFVACGRQASVHLVAVG